MSYAELQCTSNFSFLRGASHPEELAVQAKHLGLAALAVTDRNTLAGVVRAHGPRRMRSCPSWWAPGSICDRLSLLAWPTTRAAYGRLCRLLSLGQRRAGKGQCLLTLDDVCDYRRGPDLRAAARKRRSPGRGAGSGSRRRSISPSAISTAATTAPGSTALPSWRSGTRRRCSPPMTCSTTMPRAACCRTWSPPSARASPWPRRATGSRPMPSAISRRRRKWPGCSATIRRPSPIRWRSPTACRFSLDELHYEYPEEPIPPGRTPQSHLEHLAWEGAGERYPEGIPDKVKESLAKELALIAKLSYAPYFLTVHDIVALRPAARSRPSSARAGAPPPIPPCATASASPRSIPTRSSCSSSASSRKSARSRPTSTSTSSTSAARR